MCTGFVMAGTVLVGEQANVVVSVFMTVFIASLLVNSGNCFLTFTLCIHDGMTCVLSLNKV